MNEEFVRVLRSFRHLYIPYEDAIRLEKIAHAQGDTERAAWARLAKRVLREYIKKEE